MDDDCPSDQDVADFVDRRIDAKARAQLETHLDHCAGCRELISALTIAQRGVRASAATAPSSPAAVISTPKLGRFTLLERLGEGGMGVVYEAHDPALDRRVALKLLHPGAEAAGARLIREAQALARLTHPNVVAVYDVGEETGKVFVAMELVVGTTLSAWLAARPRTWREIVAVFVMAGRGLAAAHDVGFVHRDFKPDNVLVGRDGRVLVSDFGLARADDEPTSAPPPNALAEDITVTGALVGTPAYMAPEQLDGRPVDARADQFAYCVALFEALHGERPYNGVSVRTLREAIATGKLREPKQSVPAWLRRLVERGLAEDPERRFPSMAALLAELSRDRIRRRRYAIAGAGLATVAVAGWLIGARLNDRPAKSCNANDTKLASVWNPERKAAIKTAFAATKLDYTAELWSRLETTFDAYARGWAAMYTEACEATHRKGDQSEAALDLRMLCLSQRLQELDAATKLLATDPKAIAKAPQLAAGLSSLTSCADVVALKAPLQLPSDAPTRALVDEVRGKLAEAKALMNAGSWPAGIEVAQPALDKARTTNYAPVIAEALLQLGRLQMLARQDEPAEKTLEEAFYTAESSRHEEVAGRSAVFLVNHVGLNRARIADARRWARHAEAVVERSRGAFVDNEASLQHGLGNLLEEEGKLAEALEAHLRGVAIREKALGPDHALLVKPYNDLGNVYAKLGKFEEAAAQFRRALVVRERERGPNHPDVAGLKANLGTIFLSQGKFEESLASYRAAMVIWQKVLPPDHPDLGALEDNIGTALYALNRNDEALQAHVNALAAGEKAIGPDHPTLALTLDHIGNVLVRQKKYDEAFARFERARKIREKAFGPEHPTVSLSHDNTGLLFLAQGRLPEALSRFRLALAIEEKANGPDHFNVAQRLHNIARTLARQGKHADAIASYTRALTIRKAQLGEDHPDTAVTMARLAESHLARSEFAVAVQLLERAVAITEEKEPTSNDLDEFRSLLARAKHGP